MLADIYLGKIKKWNDPAIAELNPGVKLPDQAITVVHRVRRLGHHVHLHRTTCRRSAPNGRPKVGEGTSVKWPTGVGGKGNEGVAAYVQRINGAIGYVEYAYAKQNKLTLRAVAEPRRPVRRSRTKRRSRPRPPARDWSKAPGLYVVLTDQAGKTSWPITGASFILMHKAAGEAGNGEGGAEVLRLGLRERRRDGDRARLRADARSVVKLIQAAWKREIKDGAGKPSVLIAR